MSVFYRVESSPHDSRQLSETIRLQRDPTTPTMKMINHMGKHTTSKMRPLTRKTRPPRLLPPRPQRILRIQLGLLIFPPLTPIQPIMRRTPRPSLIMLLSRIILILGRDLRRIIHNLALIPRHLHYRRRRYSVALSRRRVFPSLKSHPNPPFPFRAQTTDVTPHTNARVARPSSSHPVSRRPVVRLSSFPCRPVPWQQTVLASKLEKFAVAHRAV